MKKILTILMAALLVFVMVIPCSAYGETNDLPRFTTETVDWDSTNYSHVLVFKNSEGQFWAYASEFFWYTHIDQKFIFENTFMYKLNETTGLWVKQNNSATTPQSLILSNIVPLYSTIDITSNSELFMSATPDFFLPPVPMAEQIQGVAMETLQNKTLPAVGGTMNTLTLCGVGLMACLVVLSLFGKRSLISR